MLKPSDRENDDDARVGVGTMFCPCAVICIPVAADIDGFPPMTPFRLLPLLSCPPDANVYTAHGDEGSVGVDGSELTTSAPEPSAGIELVDDTAANAGGTM